MAWFRRKRRTKFHLPPEPPAEEVRAAEKMLEDADERYKEAEDRDPEVSGRSEFLQKVHRVNHIGPQFWDAVGVRRKRT